jgi:hypothetical protein
MSWVWVDELGMYVIAPGILNRAWTGPEGNKWARLRDKAPDGDASLPRFDSGDDAFVYYPESELDKRKITDPVLRMQGILADVMVKPCSTVEGKGYEVQRRLFFKKGRVSA